MPARMIRTALFLACLAAAPAFAQEARTQAASQSDPTSRSMQQSIESVATITAVDRAKREVTLKKDDGEILTMPVPEEMTRFNEVKVGDKVRARYTVSMTAELRPPTEEEKKDPFVAIEGGGKADANEAPAAGGARMFRIVATIEAIDRKANTATLKGPKGNTVTVEVQDPTVLEKTKVGDTVVVTAAESVVVSLEKVDAKK